MKSIKFFAIALGALTFSVSASAQRGGIVFPEYQFTPDIVNPVTSVKNQASSGTCWAYSTISFVESEIIRLNKIKEEASYPDLSEFFVVSHSYSDRAVKFVRLDGKLGFSAGSEADDVLHVIADYGMVPQAEMTGMNYGTQLPRQAELDAVLAAYVNAVVKNPNGTLSTAWKRGLDSILEEYLGAYPETFVVDGKTYTPESYRDALKFNPSDYVTISSFTHHPFYSHFVMEVCDNWRFDEVYNLPIDEFMSVLDYALEHGYTAAWGSDVSDAGFTRDGLAINVDTQAMLAAKAGSDQAHWVGESEAKAVTIDTVIEKTPSQEQRQIDFDNKTVTDDHGMHIFGIAHDQFGKKYYMVKNSWGITGKYDGIWYATESFVASHSLDLMFHKDALPKDIKKKLELK